MIHVMITTAAVALAAGPATADPPLTVFGLEFGKPLGLPECPRTRLRDGTLSNLTYDDADPPETCQERNIALTGVTWRRGAFAFPIKNIPLIMSGNSGLTFMADGKLEGTQIDTLGYSNADAIIRELTAKFGKPTSITHTHAVVAGLPVPSLEAVWTSARVYVRYDSIGESVEHGALWVESPKMHQLRQSYEQAQAKDMTPL